MICPVDQTQMHQLKKIGGGISNDVLYATWELKICPLCTRVVKEYYSCEVLSAEQAITYLKKYKLDDQKNSKLESTK